MSYTLILNGKSETPYVLAYGKSEILKTFKINPTIGFTKKRFGIFSSIENKSAHL